MCPDTIQALGRALGRKIGIRIERNKQTPVARWGSGSGHREQVTGQGEMASSCSRGGSGWTSGGIPAWKGCSGLGRGCPGRFGVPIPGGVQGRPGGDTQCSGLGARWGLVTDAVSVFCEIERIVLAIQKRFLQQESIPESSLFLGEPGCNVSTSNGTHVVLQAGWSDCGTQNMTTTVVRTTLKNDVSAQGVIHHLSIASPIHCVFQNDVLTSSGYTAERLYTIFEDLHGSGYFRTEMQLLIGNSPVPRNFSVSASEDVLIEVGMQRADSQLKVVLTDCWATPTNNSVHPLSFVFISNSCPIPNTYTTLLENGNSSKAQFKMKIFSFVNNSVVYLHCRIRICMESPGSTCRTRCHAKARLPKAGETIALHRTSWGPLCKSAGELRADCHKEAGMGIGYIILIALAVLGFVLGVVTLLIFQYQRKTGRYNLRIKSDNFSYQVFYD
uniref:ZP domain-containing protein n=1 Tax=Serinus canaria TaxID=9135 RepID=A0A8C9N6X0_SERCA